MEKLVDALEKPLGRRHPGPALDERRHQEEAEAKLAAISDKIGYPEHWRDYSQSDVKRDDLLGNVERADRFERNAQPEQARQARRQDRVGHDAADRQRLLHPPLNNINFPAGILQPPFFDSKIDPAVNFGGIGVVIGHEMTHGFDDQGAKFDLHGNVAQLVHSRRPQASSTSAPSAIANEYSGFEVAPGQNLNGRLTLGENTADNGGLRIAFRALQETIAADGTQAEPGYIDGKRDGYTPEQRYFIGFAQVWCENVREANARVLAKTDPHTTGQWRVNGTVQNFDEFGKAFSCKKGQPMMPTKSCRVW